MLSDNNTGYDKNKTMRTIDNLESYLYVEDFDVLSPDDDRQHKAVALTLTIAHQERSRQRRYRCHPLLCLMPVQVVMKEPVARTVTR